MELRREEPRMIVELDELDEPVARKPGQHEAGLGQLLRVAVVELVAMAMPLVDLTGAVDRVRESAVLDEAGLRTEAHRPAEVGSRVALLRHAALILPLGDQCDDGMRRVRVELGRVRPFEPDDVAGVLDDRHLQSEADAQVRHLLLAREFHRRDLALDSALTEPARHEDRVDVVEARRYPPFGCSPILRTRC